MKKQKLCSIYTTPIGMLTIVNDGFYVTNILYGNYSCDYTFDPNNRINKQVIEELEEYFDGKRKTFDVPIAPEGTDFQKKVWNAIYKIPYGETRSYGEIAEQINKPTAVRAIGTANANNPIAIIIPSHRVVTANGSLAGYNGGMHTKKKLIELEKSTLTSINEQLLQENKNSSELLRIALHNTKMYEFYFYPKKRFLIFPDRTAKYYNLKPKFENAPESFFDEYVYPQDKKAYFDMYNKILNGEHTASATYRNYEGSNWYKVILSTIEFDENSKPIIVVGISEDITQEKIEEVEKNNLITMHQEVFSSINDIFIGIHRLDLKNGTIRSLKTVPYFENFQLNTDYNFNNWLECLSKYYHDNDRDRLCYQISLNTIIKHRDLGEHNIQETFRRFNGSSYVWISNNIIINSKSFPKDIAIILQTDVSDNYQKSSIINALGNDYFCLYYINLDDDSYEILRYDDFVKNEIKLPSNGCYSKFMKKYIQHFVHTDDVQAMENFTDIMNLRSSLRMTQDKLTHAFRKKVGNHYEWVEMRFVLSTLDGTHFITLAIKNIDDITRNEINKKLLIEDTLNSIKSINKNKNEFLSKVSHDILNPMTTIMGLTTLSKANINNSDYVKSCLEKIYTSSEELMTIINDIKNVDKWQIDSSSLSEDEFSFSNFVQSTVELIYKHIKTKHLKFTCNVENITLDRLIGDVTKLQQLLFNLLLNAIQYTNVGGRLNLTIKQLNLLPNGVVTYQFIIKDNGIGINQSEIKTIFEPFKRSQDVRVKNISGSGLGLTVAYNIAKLMNGQITLDSTINEGSTFTTTLNLTAVQENQQDFKSYTKLNVLVANSNVVELKNICNLLNSIGINTTPMYMGKDILKEVLIQHSNSKDYFAIIIDSNLSDIDYLELIKDIRKHMGRRPLKILVSSYCCDIVENNMIAFGIDYFIPKPMFKLQISKLFNTLTQNVKEYYKNSPFDVKPLKDTTCLLIQNDSTQKQISKEMLKMLGSNVYTYNNDVNYIKSNVSQGMFDYILIDVDTLSFESLRKTVKLIRNLNDKIPIIAMSSYCSQQDCLHLIDIGINCHILKPMDNNINIFLNSVIENINNLE